MDCYAMAFPDDKVLVKPVEDHSLVQTSIIKKEPESDVEYGEEELLSAYSSGVDEKPEYLEQKYLTRHTDSQDLRLHAENNTDDILIVLVEPLEDQPIIKQEPEYGEEEPMAFWGGVDDVEPETLELTCHTQHTDSKLVQMEEPIHNYEGVTISNGNQQQTKLACICKTPACRNNLERRNKKGKIQGKQRRYGRTEKFLNCGHCQYKTNKKLYLSVHMMSHSNIKPYACSQCPYRSAQQDALLTHMRTHTNEKHFACNQCSYRATERSSLNKHMKTHSKEKPFACSQCSYRTAQRSNLIKHVRTHTDEKYFSCCQCPYKAARRGELITHLRTHTNEKPFACSQCSYRAAQRYGLVRHMRTHTNEKPFGCIRCSYRAADRSNLSKHMSTHTNEKPFVCCQCSYRAARRAHLVSHMRMHAGGLLPVASALVQIQNIVT